jgi:hypothetical protein
MKVTFIEISKKSITFTLANVKTQNHGIIQLISQKWCTHQINISSRNHHFFLSKILVQFGKQSMDRAQATHHFGTTTGNCFGY